jgi:telomerase Cajal body protein 1
MTSSLQLKCIAESRPEGATNGAPPPSPPSYRTVHWTADGTSLLATTSNHSITTHIVPSHLLSPRTTPLPLGPYSTITSSEPVNALASPPFFNLQDPSTALVLSSQKDHPIRLNSALTGARLASYPLINAQTEAYINPAALAFSSADGRHFVAGAESLLAVFDLHVSGSVPIVSTQTGPKRRGDDRWNPSCSVRGIVSALDVDFRSEVLAVGTFSRQVGLFAAGGRGECVGAFSLEGNGADGDIGGGGVTQVRWSACGRYLYIAERRSDGIVVYDIRNTGQLVSWCRGRKASSSQRLAFDLASNPQGGCEVWAGGRDGVFRMWSDVQDCEGAVEPSFELKAHDDPVTGTSVHGTGSVLVTCAGEDYASMRDRLIEGPSDRPGGTASLKLWSLNLQPDDELSKKELSA